MLRTISRMAAVVLIIGTLSACSTVFGSEELPEPVGIGRGTNDLKRSPCACIELPQHYEDWATS